MTYSFDIFDTCLIRKCGKPEIVFEILAERILGKDSGASQIFDFVYIRKEAEGKAIRLNNRSEEITIDDIYDNCDFSDLTNISKDTIKQTELRIEKEQLIAVYDIGERISEIRKSGNTIVYISDMYLPQSFIEGILIEQGLLHDGDKLYVSSKFGVKKVTGNIFRLVKQDMQLDYNQWVHHGDNKFSDIEVPRKLGIKVKHISHNYSYYEKEWFSQVPLSSRNYKSLCASFSRAIRLTYKSSPYIDFASDFIAPLYVSFVSSILRDASSKGINNLYFLARDGYIFYNIAEILKKDFPNIDLHYIYASRKSLYLPGLDEVTDESIKKMVLGDSLMAILDCFQLEEVYDKFRQYDKLYGEELIASLIKDERFIQLLRERQSSQRSLLLQYLIEQGLSGDASAIVDLNGTRNCHKIICKILEQAGYNAPYGYFLTLSDKHITGNDYKAMFVNMNNRFVCTLPPVMMLEEYFSLANHSSTKSYTIGKTGKVEPVLGEDTIDNKTKNQIFDINKKVCMSYAEFYRDYIDDKISQELCYSVLSIITEFINAPTYRLLKPFENLTFSWTPVLKVKMIREGNLFSLLKNKNRSAWFVGEFVYRFPFHNLATWLLRIVFFVRKRRSLSA